MKNKEAVNFISLILVALTGLLLLAAMLFHAIEGDESVTAVVFAGASAGIGFLALIFLIIKGNINEKGENDENEKIK